MTVIVVQKSITCPTCGAILMAATPIEGNPVPRPGDLTICIYCRSVLRFHPDGYIKLTNAEIDTLHPDNITAIREFVDMLQKNPPRVDRKLD